MRVAVDQPRHESGAAAIDENSILGRVRIDLGFTNHDAAIFDEDFSGSRRTNFTGPNSAILEVQRRFFSMRHRHRFLSVLPVGSPACPLLPSTSGSRSARLPRSPSGVW